MSDLFPQTAEHAMHILDATDNDFEEARSICRTNAMNAADDEGFLYWASVLKALRPFEHIVDRGFQC